MTQTSYGQFCPVAMAAEIVSTRWTVVLLRELMAGSTRFNELRRGLPRMSPALLSQRLKELEAAEVLTRRPGEAGAPEYHLTASGRDLKGLLDAFGTWGQRWSRADEALRRLDAGLLMWDMRRGLDPKPMPARRNVLQFTFPDQPASRRNWWLIVDPAGGVDLANAEPGQGSDLQVSVDLRSMTAIWLGFDTVRAALGSGRMQLSGDAELGASMPRWLGLGAFAAEPKQAG